MRFSEKYMIQRNSQDDWYDPLLFADTPLYIDPFLIWAEERGRWASAHDHLLDFFEMAFELVRESNGNQESFEWAQAGRLLMFPEPPEFCLGVSEGSPLGSGSGKSLQQDMLSGILVATNLGMNRIAHMETIGLFQGGVGLDRLSDAACDVLKSKFIQYTKEVCQRHGIPVEPISVRNASWSTEFRKWNDERHSLPVNVVKYRRQGRIREKKIPVLLTPERFLKDIPIANPDGFWNWAWSNMGKDLRGDVSYDIVRRVTKRQKAKLARENPDVVALYLRELEEGPIEPYPIAEDPKLLVTWYEQGKQWMRDAGREYRQLEEKDFEKFTDALVEAFVHGVEFDSWRLLWANGRPLEERASQALFRSVVVHYCKANDVDLTGESDAGRGPVDFKFSRGWSGRALLEVKLVKNSKFWDGILAQQPTYQLAEEVRRGYFLAVAFTDKENDEKIKKKLEDAGKIVAERYGISINIVVVDARPKVSGSKTRSQELADELHRSEHSEDPNSPA